jgi:hypothetical protein
MPPHLAKLREQTQAAHRKRDERPFARAPNRFRTENEKMTGKVAPQCRNIPPEDAFFVQ